MKNEFNNYKAFKAQDCPIEPLIIKYRECIRMIDDVDMKISELNKKRNEVNELRNSIQALMINLESI